VYDPTLTNLGFTFVAQNPYDSATITSTSPITQPHFFSYSWGSETKLREVLSDLDANTSTILWLLAINGIDGDAGTGIVYTLVKEFQGRKIHLGVFPESYTTQSQVDTIIRYAPLLEHDTVVHFTPEGFPIVPKVVPCPSPTGTTSLEHSAPWVSDKITTKPTPKVYIGHEEVVVEPSAWSQESPSLRGLVGKVIESRHKNLPVGTSVAGITDTGELTNRFVKEGRYLVPVPPEVANLNLTGDLVSILVAGLLLDCRHARTAKKLRILIPEPEAIALVPQMLEKSNLFGDVEVGTPSQDDGFDLIVLDSATNSEHPELSSWLSESGRVLIWDTRLHETDRLDQLFTAGLLYYSPNTKTDTKAITPEDVLSTSTPASTELPPFKPDKAYILLGGASDLGVAMALWLYQVGSITPFVLIRELIGSS
jgi:hypothetical protein